MSQKIKLDFEIPQGYYTQEELNNYIKNSISKYLNEYTVNGYSTTTDEIITIPLKDIIRGVNIDIDRNV